MWRRNLSPWHTAGGSKERHRVPWQMGISEGQGRKILSTSVSQETVKVKLLSGWRDGSVFLPCEYKDLSLASRTYFLKAEFGSRPRAPTSTQEHALTHLCF